MSKFGEPWLECPGPMGAIWDYTKYRQLNSGCATTIYRPHPRWPEAVEIMATFTMDKETSRRIVDCVNAMAGVEDPVGFMRKIRALGLCQGK